MNSITCALVIISCVALCQSCGFPELAKKGKAMGQMAEGWCKSGIDDAKKKKISDCGQKEFDAAKGKPYHDYLEKGMKKCVNNEMMKDPCSKTTKEQGEKCAKEFMKENPNLKTEAMKWVGPHCKDFMGHMERFEKCVS